MNNGLLLKNIDDCPDIKEHTLCPTGYTAWHEWAEKMSETHRNIRCKGCGYWAIWIPLKQGEVKSVSFN